MKRILDVTKLRYNTNNVIRLDKNCSAPRGARPRFGVSSVLNTVFGHSRALVNRLWMVGLGLSFLAMPPLAVWLTPRLTAQEGPAFNQPNLPTVPLELPGPQTDGVIYLTGEGGVPRATTLLPALQQHLTDFIEQNHEPIAAVVVVDAHTGAILAMAQGRAPGEWGSKTHSALHASFPAASVFKTVVTTAAFEMADVDEQTPLGLTGGCSHVRESGEWLNEKEPTRVTSMTLRQAFGHSCNGFFAKLGVNHLGLGIISNFARRYGWETGVPADFHIDHSPFFPPAPNNSSTHTVGSFSAGFGKVGLSAVHAAYVMLTVANRGAPMPLRLFRDTPLPPPAAERPRIFSERTAERFGKIIDASVRGGTATSAFRNSKYRKLREVAGGKTGTLTGTSPHGLTTWFAGYAPTAAPEVIVASVVMLDDHWHIKAPALAAEGMWAYFDQLPNQKAVISATYGKVAKVESRSVRK